MKISRNIAQMVNKIGFHEIISSICLNNNVKIRSTNCNVILAMNIFDKVLDIEC